MKRRIKFLISLALIPLMFLSFITSSLLFINAKAEGLDYRQKIVAVVYDDSGSMGSNNRVDYAKYAMQGLVSMLSSSDILEVFPLNNFTGVSKDYLPDPSKNGPKSYKVDLSVEDRNAEISKLISSGQLNAGGSTPSEAVTVATNWLASKGLNKDEVLEDKEFWLVVLSDGQFDPPNWDTTRKNTSQIIREGISGYVGLQTIYFAMCVSSDSMLIKDLEAENSAVTAFDCKDATEIIDNMQKLSNRLTGRYSMTSGFEVDTSGAKPKVNIDLSGCGFSIASVQVLAQWEAQTAGTKLVQLKIDEQAGVTYLNSSGASEDVNLLRPCSMVADVVGVSGCSATITPKSDSGVFSGGKLSLTLSDKPTSLTVLLEPAVMLDATLQYKKDGAWVDADEETINSTLKKGTEVRAKYRLVDKFNKDKDLTSVLKDVTAKVSYNGKTFDYGNGFALETGKKEVVLSVTVNISGSEYTLHKSWLCFIDENPASFKVTSKTTKDYGGNPEKVKIDYSIVYDGNQIKKEDIDGNDKILTWQLIELTNPKGETITPDSAKVNDDGTISVIFSTKQGEYGAYTSKLKVVCIENKRARTAPETVRYFPATLSLDNGNTTSLSLSANQLKDNTSKFEFKLDSKGFPINFDSGVVDYKLTVGGTDVTSLASINGNVLTFTPDTTTITGSLQNVGEKDIKLEVWSTEDSSVNVSKTLDFEIVNSIYVIETLPQDTLVDIYDLKNCKAKTYYKVSIDGEWLNEEQLSEGLANGSIKVDTKPFGWILLLPTKATTTVENLNGDAVICVSIGTNWFSPLDNLVASLIITGEKKVALKYGNAVGETIFDVQKVPFMSRFWRWLIIILVIYIIVHIVLWIVGFFVAKSLPKGVMLKIRIHEDVTRKLVRPSVTRVNVDVGEIIKWHLMRFIPFKELTNQPERSIYGIKLCVNKSGTQVMIVPKGLIPGSIPKRTGNLTYKTYIDYETKCGKINAKSGNPNFAKEIITADFIKLIKLKKPYVANTSVGVSKTYYAKKKDGKICEVYVFIRTTKY